MMGETRLTRSEVEQIVKAAMLDSEVRLRSHSIIAATIIEDLGDALQLAPEPTPEPTVADGEIVRVEDADGDIWGPPGASGAGVWRCLTASWSGRLWSDIPQPVTVLRPEADRG